jgi:hypothetical protein
MQNGRTAERRKGRLADPVILPVCLAAIALCLSLTGCTHAQAKTTPDMPALEMPEPPPRDVEPTDVGVPPPMPLVAEPVRNVPARPRAAPAAPRPETPRPVETPAAVEPPKPPDEPPKPQPTLQTAPATADGDVERGIRASLQRATADLNRIDYRALNADARTQYDTAKRFVQQADDAVRAKNLVFAKQLAEKAASLASQLAGR